MRPSEFQDRGYCVFRKDPEVLAWVNSVRPVAIALAQDPELQKAGCDAGGTWFAGVNILPNTRTGAFGQSGPLAGAAVDFVQENYGGHSFGWDQAQVSVVYPGYPMPMEASAEAFGYRSKRDAAHMDGLHPVGRNRRRHWRELHGFVLGLPLSEASAQAAPLVVWEGSHEILREALTRAYDNLPYGVWPECDVTEIYQKARREIFAQCKRVELPVKPGEATLMHRFALHGVAPWGEAASASPEGRMIAYFRPSLEWSAEDALRLP